MHVFLNAKHLTKKVVFNTMTSATFISPLKFRLNVTDTLVSTLLFVFFIATVQNGKDNKTSFLSVLNHYKSELFHKKTIIYLNLPISADYPITVMEL